MIHPTAIVDPKADIGDEVEIGPYALIERGGTIGPRTRIGPHVVIREGTQMGKQCQIFQFASVGEAPQAIAYKGEKTLLLMGDHNIVREFVTLNRGTAPGGGKTVIDHGNLFMAYSHVAHDCQIGNQVILANGATLAGHITIEDYAIIGGLCEGPQEGLPYHLSLRSHLGEGGETSEGGRDLSTTRGPAPPPVYPAIQEGDQSVSGENKGRGGRCRVLRPVP